MYKIYKVLKGETLEDIATKFNTTVEELSRINASDSMLTIQEGDFIIVPMPRGSFFDVYTIKPGDTMYAIGKKYSATEEDLLKLNGIDKDDYIYPGEEILVPKTGVRFYITNEGDTMNSASEVLNVRPGQILLQNENVYLLPEQLLVYKKDTE